MIVSLIKNYKMYQFMLHFHDFRKSYYVDHFAFQNGYRFLQILVKQLYKSIVNIYVIL